jgi:hypothetical protein
MPLDFPNSPSVGSLFTSGAQTWKWDGTKWAVASSGGLQGDGVNLLRRNGGVEIWQRGAGGSAAFNVLASSAAYTADGWYMATGANQLCYVAQQPGLVAGSQSSCIFLRNTGQTGVGAMAVGFPLDTDELWPALGKFVRLSCMLAAGTTWSPAGGNISVFVQTGTGTPIKATLGYTGLVNVIAQTFPITTTPTRFQFNSTIAVPTNTRQMEVTFVWTPVGTAGVGDGFYIDDVQLEIVPAATGYVSSDFQRLNFNEQLRLCQRHFWKTFDYDVAPASNLGWGQFSPLVIAQPVGPGVQYYGASYPNPVPMRAVPTAIGYNPGAAGNQMQCGVINQPYTSTGFGLYKNEIVVSGVTPAGSAIGYPGSVHFTVDAGI